MIKSSLPILLKEPKILLIGAGNIGFDKAKVLLQNSIEFRVISKEIDEKFSLLGVMVEQKEFTVDDASGYHYIIDATGEKNVCHTLLELKKTHFFLLNVVDQPKYCDFYFMALLEYGHLKISVSSSGASPTLAQGVRDRIKHFLPDTLRELTHKTMLQRQEGHINVAKTKKELGALVGKVYLVGCGTGDVDLLTLKAYRTIQNADVVLIDHLINQEIIECVLPNVTKILVGKQKGAHSIKQEAINEMLLTYAKEGLSVVRLKSGDPYIFGRGVEEALFLIEHNINVEVIPGISSAIGAPLSAGIAPTARGYASSFSVVSAHLRGNRINLDWCELLKRENHTTIVLMGVSRAKEIVEEALEIGVKKELKVSIISNATRSNQHVVTTTLQELTNHTEEILKPALLVFGEVVSLHTQLPNYQHSLQEQSCSF